MLNYCHTNYAFKGKRDEILDFYSKINEFTSKEGLPNSFGDKWLGNILNGFGFNVDTCRIKHRGYLTYLKLEESSEDINAVLLLSTKTACYPLTIMWDKLLKKYYPEITYVLYVEEPVGDIYINTDLEGIHFSKKYKISSNLPSKYNIIDEYASSEKGVLEIINNAFRRHYKSLRQCEKRLYKEFKKCADYSIYIHHYETTYKEK